MDKAAGDADHDEDEAKAPPRVIQDVSTTRAARAPETLVAVPTTGSGAMSGALASFLRVLLEENTALRSTADDNEDNDGAEENVVSIVVDNAAILPDRYAQSYHMLVQARNSSSHSSMPELSRWESHVVRTPTNNSVQLLEERERAERDRRERAAVNHALPTRPQRRTSFELDRTNNDRLILPNNDTTDTTNTMSDNSSRRAFSQSLTQLDNIVAQQLQQEQVVCKKTMPPRVPIRRSSGRAQQRVHSPPPQPRRNRRSSNSVSSPPASSQTGGDDNIDESGGSFRLQFSSSELDLDESDSSDGEDNDALAVQQVVKDIQSLASGARKASAEQDQRRRAGHRKSSSSGGLSLSDHTPSSLSPPPRQTDTSRRQQRGSPKRFTVNRRANTRRSASMNDDGLPILESFSNHPPHLRVLPPQSGARRMGLDLDSSLHLNNNAIDNSDNMLTTRSSAMRHQDTNTAMAAPPAETNTAPTATESHDETEVHQSKVASSKVSFTNHRSYDIREHKVGGSDDSTNKDNTTTEKAAKKSILSRVTHKVVKTVTGKRGGSNTATDTTPVPSTNDTKAQESS